MKTIYLVQGSTGEFDDKRSWIVCGYSRRQSAEKHAKLCTDWYKDNGGILLRRNNLETKNPYDPEMQIDYTGTTWGVFPVPFFQSVRSVH